MKKRANCGIKCGERNEGGYDYEREFKNMDSAVHGIRTLTLAEACGVRPMPPQYKERRKRKKKRGKKK